jgi:Ser/Thr protein kinase RdoA (MazF antagonist)
MKDIENPEPFLLKEFGTFMGKLDIAFREFGYPDLKRKWIWDVRNIDFLQSHLDYIESEPDKAIVRHFITNYQLNIVPNEKYLRTQYIHNDGNDHNVLLNDNGHISGVIDFGDMAHTFLASELAVAITYLILEEAEPETKIHSVVKGFQSVYPLRDEEIESLIHLVCVRACFTVVTANYRKKLFPDNKYISVTEPYAWTFLKNFADKELSNFKIY